MTPPNIVLLDIMDTVVHDPFFMEVPAFHGRPLADLARDMDRDAWFAFERGEIDEDTYRQRYFRDRRAVDLDGVKDCMRRAYRFKEGMKAVLDDLVASGAQLYALSNYPVWYQIIDEELLLHRYLKWDFVSCHLGVRKPDPAIYAKVLAALDEEAARCVFVDDRQVNVDAAVASGMHGHCFAGADGLRSMLVDLGVLASTPKNDKR